MWVREGERLTGLQEAVRHAEGVTVVRVRVRRDGVRVREALRDPVRLKVRVGTGLAVKEGLGVWEGEEVAVGKETVGVAVGWGVRDRVPVGEWLWLRSPVPVAVHELPDRDGEAVGGEGVWEREGRVGVALGDEEGEREGEGLRVADSVRAGVEEAVCDGGDCVDVKDSEWVGVPVQERLRLGVPVEERLRLSLRLPDPERDAGLSVGVREPEAVVVALALEVVDHVTVRERVHVGV